MPPPLGSRDKPPEGGTPSAVLPAMATPSAVLATLLESSAAAGTAGTAGTLLMPKSLGGLLRPMSSFFWFVSAMAVCVYLIVMSKRYRSVQLLVLDRSLSSRAFSYHKSWSLKNVMCERFLVTFS